MKKIVKLSLICFAAVLQLSGCAKEKKTEDEIRYDIRKSGDFFNSQEVEIDEIEITKRVTEKKNDLIYVDVYASNKNIECVLSYKADYNLYKEGWVLDSLSKDRNGEWEIIPKREPDEALVEKYISSNAVLNEKELNLDHNKAEYCYTESNDGSIKQISYKFVFDPENAEWVFDGSTETMIQEASAPQSDSAAQAAAAGIPVHKRESTEPVTLSLSWWGGESRNEATMEAVKAFEKKYPNITVDCTFGLWEGWEQRQLASLLGGNASDVLQINMPSIPYYYENGISLLNLKDYSDAIDLSQFSAASLEQCSIGNQLIGIPASQTGCVFYWNKSVFDEVGCPIPVDQKSLFEAGKAFREYNQSYYPLALNEYDRAVFLVYYLESIYGKPWIAQGKPQYTVGEIQKGMEFIKKMEAEHVIPTIAAVKSDGSSSWNQNIKWIDGEYAGVYNWDTMGAGLQAAIERSERKPDQQLVIGDFIKFGAYNGGFVKVSMVLAVSPNCKNPLEASMLINYLLNDEEGAEICGIQRGIPCSAAAVRALNDKDLGDDFSLSANKKAVEYCEFSYDLLFDAPELKSTPGGVYDVVFSKLSSGEIDSLKAAQDLLAGINSCLIVK